MNLSLKDLSATKESRAKTSALDMNILQTLVSLKSVSEKEPTSHNAAESLGDGCPVRENLSHGFTDCT